jgi:hypothetical protein
MDNNSKALSLNRLAAWADPCSLTAVIFWACDERDQAAAIWNLLVVVICLKFLCPGWYSD